MTARNLRRLFWDVCCRWPGTKYREDWLRGAPFTHSGSVERYCFLSNFAWTSAGNSISCWVKSFKNLLLSNKIDCCSSCLSRELTPVEYSDVGVVAAHCYQLRFHRVDRNAPETGIFRFPFRVKPDLKLLSHKINQTKKLCPNRLVRQ